MYNKLYSFKMALVKSKFWEINFNIDISKSEYIRKSLQKEGSTKEICDLMKDEYYRFITFYPNLWSILKPNPKYLTEAGLFYLQRADEVQCFYCGITIDDWDISKKPLRKHIEKNPKCPFLIGLDVENCPLLEKNLNNNLICKQKPINPKMANVYKRYKSFNSWPIKMPTPKMLAENGFFYTDFIDVVRCYFCSGALGFWCEGDDPKMDHEKNFPYCPFLKISNPEKILDGGFKKEKNSLKERTKHDLTCKVCMQFEMCMVFQPCGHLSTCFKCSDKITKCPICREFIIAKIRAYIC